MASMGKLIFAECEPNVAVVFASVSQSLLKVWPRPSRKSGLIEKI